MALFDFLKKNPSEKQGNATLDIKVKVKTTVEYVDVFQKTKGKLKMADIDGYVSPSGGYMNYAIFIITGKYAETGRRRKKTYEAQDRETAILLAKNDGFVEPFEIEVEKLPEPTERQLEYARDLRASIPEGACKYDVSAIISRITDEDELPPDAGLSRYAHACGVQFSRFIGRETMLACMIGQMREEKLATLYAYAVYLNEKGGAFSDPRALPVYDRLLACGKYVAQDESLLKSLDGRSANDFRKPNKGTKIYKAVAEYLGIK